MGARSWRLFTVDVSTSQLPGLCKALNILRSGKGGTYICKIQIIVVMFSSLGTGISRAAALTAAVILVAVVFSDVAEAVASYPPIPADKTTPIHQRLSLKGPTSMLSNFASASILPYELLNMLPFPIFAHSTQHWLEHV